MTASNARRGSPLPPMTRAEQWQRFRWLWGRVQRKGRWQRPDVFARNGGWDRDHHYARADIKRRAIEDQRG